MNISVQVKDNILLLNIDAGDVTSANFPQYASQLRQAIINNYTPGVNLAAIVFKGSAWVEAATVCIVQMLVPTVGIVQGNNIIVVSTTTPEYAPGMVIPLPK